MTANVPYEPEVEAARQAVFQKVGHIVLRIQHMERLLKFLLGTCQFSGTLSDFKERFAKQTSEYSKDTLGQLVAELPDRLVITESAQAQMPPDASEPLFSFQFGFEQGSAVVAEWTSCLKGVKDERNALVHHFLEVHNLTTVEGCEKASAALDSQRERTLQPYEFLLSLVHSIKAHYDDIQAGQVRFTVQRSAM